MNRYELAVKFKALLGDEVCFSQQNSVDALRKCILFCAHNNFVFNGKNTQKILLDKAIISISKKTGFPVIVDSFTEATILSTAYNHKNIYPVSEKVPGNKIYYGGNPPENTRFFVIVKKR